MKAITRAPYDDFPDHGFLPFHEATDHALYRKITEDFDGWVENINQSTGPYSTTLGGGIRVVFGPGNADLRPLLRRVNALIGVSRAHFALTVDSRLTRDSADLAALNAKRHPRKINFKLLDAKTAIERQVDFLFAPYSNGKVSEVDVLFGREPSYHTAKWFDWLHDGLFPGVIEDGPADPCRKESC